MFKWYRYCWGKFLVFKGRASRAEFWSFVVVSAVLPLILFLLYFLLGNAMREENAVETTGQLVAAEPISALSSILGAIIFIWGLLNLFPYLAVTVRRLHDTGHTGWWLFWSWIFPPLQIVILIFMLIGTEPMPNMYGVRPPKSPKDQVPNYYQNQAQMWMEFEKSKQNPGVAGSIEAKPGLPPQAETVDPNQK